MVVMANLRPCYRNNDLQGDQVVFVTSFGVTALTMGREIPQEFLVRSHDVSEYMKTLKQGFGR